MCLHVHLLHDFGSCSTDFLGTVVKFGGITVWGASLCFKLSSMETSDCLVLQLMQDIRSGEHENDFTGTPKVPVYVKLPVSICHFAAIISCIEINLLISSYQKKKKKKKKKSSDKQLVFCFAFKKKEF
jgi:hypothetical protein